MVINKTIKGGAYLMNGIWVDANGIAIQPPTETVKGAKDEAWEALPDEQKALYEENGINSMAELGTFFAQGNVLLPAKNIKPQTPTEQLDPEVELFQSIPNYEKLEANGITDLTGFVPVIRIVYQIDRAIQGQSRSRRKKTKKITP